MDINNKVIAITGGAQGLGFAIAETLIKKGAHIALIDLQQEKLQQAVADLTKNGGTCKGYVANVTNEDDVAQTFNDICRDFGALHGLINNAGITRDGLLIKAKDGVISSRMSLQNWQSVIDINLTGVFLCTREAATKMIELNCQGVICNISSVCRAGNVGQSNYSATKAGVSALTVTWAKELARNGIRCMAIAPGYIATDMVKSMKPEALDKMTSQIPAGRLGEAEEIALTAAFIFENDYINGRTLEVDGGIRI